MDTLQDWLLWGEKKLEEAGIEEASIDAKYLLFDAFHINSVNYLMERNQPLIARGEELTCYQRYINKREGRMPIQYILGFQEFMGLRFEVNQSVLIPRQDTETLVETVLRENPRQNLAVLDMCTGSGCIAISLKKLGRYKSVTGIDISEEALKVARKNGIDNQCQVDWIRSDLFKDVQDGSRFDLIVSNPPYIPTKVISKLQPEVYEFEPFIALDGNEDGLNFYRILASGGKTCLWNGGKIYFEIGCDQADEVTRILLHHGYEKISVIKDEPGHDRVVRAVLGGL